MPAKERRERRSEELHRRELVQQVVDGAERRANVGQWLGAVIILITIVAGLVAIFSGHEIGGALLVASAINNRSMAYVAGGRASRSR